MSAQRQKGTGWESELLPLLRAVFGQQVERAPLKGIDDKGDFVGVPWQHEAKKSDAPHFLQWAKIAQKKTPDRWAILWSGDRRKGDGPFVMLPLGHYLELAVAGTQRLQASYTTIANPYPTVVDL
jgi:hypothetical protein